MDQPLLSDKTKFPTDEIILSHLGKTKDVGFPFLSIYIKIILILYRSGGITTMEKAGL